MIPDVYDATTADVTWETEDYDTADLHARTERNTECDEHR